MARNDETEIPYREGGDFALIRSNSQVFHRYMEKKGLMPYRQSEETRFYRVPKRLIGARKRRKRAPIEEESSRVS
jgi:hypothetical protein